MIYRDRAELKERLVTKVILQLRTVKLSENKNLVNKTKEMVSFEFGEEREKDVFRQVTKKKFWVPNEESFIHRYR